MPNKYNIKLWVEALRSGEYQQSQKVLHNNQGYCCLGVACEVYQKEVGGLDISALGDRVVGQYDLCTTVLPEKVVGWFGLDGANPSIGNGNAVFMNDTLGWSFSKIADVLEEAFL